MWLRQASACRPARYALRRGGVDEDHPGVERDRLGKPELDRQGRGRERGEDRVELLDPAAERELREEAADLVREGVGEDRRGPGIGHEPPGHGGHRGGEPLVERAGEVEGAGEAVECASVEPDVERRECGQRSE